MNRTSCSDAYPISGAGPNQRPSAGARGQGHGPAADAQSILG